MTKMANIIQQSKDLASLNNSKLKNQTSVAKAKPNSKSSASQSNIHHSGPKLTHTKNHSAATESIQPKHQSDGPISSSSLSNTKQKDQVSPKSLRYSPKMKHDTSELTGLGRLTMSKKSEYWETIPSMQDHDHSSQITAEKNEDERKISKEENFTTPVSSDLQDILTNLVNLNDESSVNICHTNNTDTNTCTYDTSDSNSNDTDFYTDTDHTTDTDTHDYYDAEPVKDSANISHPITNRSPMISNLTGLSRLTSTLDTSKDWKFSNPSTKNETIAKNEKSMERKNSHLQQTPGGEATESSGSGDFKVTKPSSPDLQRMRANLKDIRNVQGLTGLSRLAGNNNTVSDNGNIHDNSNNPTSITEESLEKKTANTSPNLMHTLTKFAKLNNTANDSSAQKVCKGDDSNKIDPNHASNDNGDDSKQSPKDDEQNKDDIRDDEESNDTDNDSNDNNNNNNNAKHSDDKTIPQRNDNASPTNFQNALVNLANLNNNRSIASANTNPKSATNIGVNEESVPLPNLPNVLANLMNLNNDSSKIVDEPNANSNAGMNAKATKINTNEDKVPSPNIQNVLANLMSSNNSYNSINNCSSEIINETTANTDTKTNTIANMNSKGESAEPPNLQHVLSNLMNLNNKGSCHTGEHKTDTIPSDLENTKEYQKMKMLQGMFQKLGNLPSTSNGVDNVEK
eukprot:Awhi_evm2s10187